MTSREFVVGLFVGGKGSRLGGVKKGLLLSPEGDEAIAARSLRLCRDALPGAHVTLIGDASGYEALALEALVDDPPGVGPIGGLRALLLAARARGPNTLALALACDLPSYSLSLLDRLAYFGDQRFTVAPRLGELYQPLFARYEPESALAAVDLAIAERSHSLLGVLDRLGSAVIELPLLEGDAELLLDWDTPGDVRRSRPHLPDRDV
jgi:molybdopterin-guanine dinucleotide biosynthesis protein A